MTDPLGRAWRVRRTSGLLVPGFRKRFSPDGTWGVTYLLLIRVGAFDVRRRDDGSCEFRYRAWPVVDVLESHPHDGTESIPAIGTVRLPGRRRSRFCRFALEAPATPE